jgi:hypothetical protein
MSIASIREHLDLLRLERLQAELAGGADCGEYVRDLNHEIAEYEAAYVCAAVVEIALLRAELSGAQHG